MTADRFDWPVSDFDGPNMGRELAPDYPAPWVRSNWYAAWYQIKPGVYNYHTGDDLYIPGSLDEGAPLYAVANGTVIYARHAAVTSTWGNVIVIEHLLPTGEFVYSRYGHLLTMFVTEGDIVTRGHTIGLVGNSDNKFAYHAHVDIGGAKLKENPLDWPGTNKARVMSDYYDPHKFILEHRVIEEPEPMPRETMMVNNPSVAGRNLRTKPNGTEVRFLPNGTLLTPLAFTDSDATFDWQAFFVIDTKEVGWIAIRAKATGRVYVTNP